MEVEDDTHTRKNVFLTKNLPEIQYKNVNKATHSKERNLQSVNSKILKQFIQFKYLIENVEEKLNIVKRI